MAGSAYGDLGVSSTKEAVHAATKNNGRGLYPFAFCKINRMRGDKKWVEIMHADGAGTKTSLAYMYWRETGDMSVWKGVVQDSIVMNLDDVACVGGLTGYISLASNIDRNSFRIPGEVVAALIEGENVFLKKMRKHGVYMIGQCGETADVPDLTKTVVVNNALSCRMREDRVINNGKISVGDYIVGLSSCGQATYEDEYNSGIRSNGLTLARHAVLSEEYRAKYPESYHEELGDKAYRGTKKLTDMVKVETGEEISVGKLLLSPTRTYAPIVRVIHKTGLDKCISGMVHNSGGGMTKVMNYLSKPCAAYKYALPASPLKEPPAVFDLIRREGDIEWDEMNRTFNMGCGFEIYTPHKVIADKIVALAKTFNVDAAVIGKVEPAPDGGKYVSVFVGNGSYSQKIRGA